jgi:hydroxymethylpyrimidine/phosphomethylpyrimidine kinase
MLGSRPLLEAAGAALRGPLAGIPVVVDPVLATSSRGALYQGNAEDYSALLDRLDLLTPNLAEAEALTGIACRTEEAMPAAARALLGRGARAVLLKGGHLEGAPADLLVSSGRERWFRGLRHAAHRRGTGCRLASAIAAHLAHGRALEEGVERSIEWLRGWIATG